MQNVCQRPFSSKVIFLKTDTHTQPTIALPEPLKRSVRVCAFAFSASSMPKVPVLKYQYLECQTLGDWYPWSRCCCACGQYGHWCRKCMPLTRLDGSFNSHISRRSIITVETTLEPTVERIYSWTEWQTVQRPVTATELEVTGLRLADVLIDCGSWTILCYPVGSRQSRRQKLVANITTGSDDFPAAGCISVIRWFVYALVHCSLTLFADVNNLHIERHS